MKRIFEIIKKLKSISHTQEEMDLLVELRVLLHNVAGVINVGKEEL